MQVTTIAEARALVGRTFERDGEKMHIDSIIVQFSSEEWGLANVSQFSLGVDQFDDWLSGATDVTEGSVSE